MGLPRPLFIYFRSFSNKQYKFYQKINAKNVISIHLMELGFECTTSQTWVVFHNQTGLPPKIPSVLLFWNIQSLDEAKLVAETSLHLTLDYNCLWWSVIGSIDKRERKCSAAFFLLSLTAQKCLARLVTWSYRLGFLALSCKLITMFKF